MLANAGNLYGYTPVTEPITKDVPLTPATRKGRARARMWTDAIKAHRAGRLRTTGARASDYIGPGALSWLTETVLKPVAAGKRAMAPADLDAPHSWTHTADAARGTRWPDRSSGGGGGRAGLMITYRKPAPPLGPLSGTPYAARARVKPMPVPSPEPKARCTSSSTAGSR